MEVSKEKVILLKAADLFARYGVKSMTMDEIARNLGISKKTLYQYVDNKKDLVKRCIQEHIDSEECMVQEFLGESDNAIDELMGMTKMVSTQMKEMHPSVIFDLKKYHFEAYERLTSHRDEFIYGHIKENLERGIQEGLYREKVQVEIVARLYIAMANVIIDPQTKVLEQYSTAVIYNEIVRYHLQGVVSEKGKKYIERKLNQENQP